MNKNKSWAQLSPIERIECLERAYERLLAHAVAAGEMAHLYDHCLACNRLELAKLKIQLEMQQ
jgi:hypothetical protein